MNNVSLEDSLSTSRTEQLLERSEGEELMQCVLFEDQSRALVSPHY